jgi:hypothetical protein
VLFVVLFVVLALAAVANWMPLRKGAACTPSTHRARRGLGVLCGAVALVGFSRFVWFVVIHGHDWRSFNVFIGQVVSITLLAQAVLLMRDAFPRRSVAVFFGGCCGALSMLALVRAVMWIAAH